MWYLEPPTIPLRPQYVLTHVQRIEMMLHLPPGPSKNPFVSIHAPLTPIETRVKATKTTTNTIYVISSTSRPSVSSLVENPPDLSRHHLRNDREICKNAFDFTPFPLNHSMESVLPIKDQIPSPHLANDLRLGKGAYLFLNLMENSWITPVLRPQNSQATTVRDSPQSTFPTSPLNVWYRESIRFAVRLP